jgi:hypothetical protein
MLLFSRNHSLFICRRRRRLSMHRLHALVPLPPTAFPPQRHRRQQDHRHHDADDYHPRSAPPQARPAESQIGPRIRRVPYYIVVPRRIQALRSRPIATTLAGFFFGMTRSPGFASAGFRQGLVGGGGRGARASAVLNRFQGMCLRFTRCAIGSDFEKASERKNDELRRYNERRKINSRPPRACTSSREPR